MSCSAASSGPSIDKIPRSASDQESCHLPQHRTGTRGVKRCGQTRVFVGARGSVSRISAPDIEEIVETAVCNRINEPERSRDETFAEIRRVVVTEGTISLRSDPHDQCSIEIPWTRKVWKARPNRSN